MQSFSMPLVVHIYNILTTSRPELIWTAVGQLSVFNVSTIPRAGFRARFAIPVLNFIDGMSKMAVPVVSDPVPAVVGTWAHDECLG